MENFHSVFSFGEMPAKKHTFFFSQDHCYIASSRLQYLWFLHMEAKLHTSVFRDYKETPVMMMSVQANRQGWR